MKIIAFISYRVEVPYELEVEDPTDIKEIKDKLLDIDPADWYSDPEFYENLGSEWRHLVEEHVVAIMYDLEGKSIFQEFDNNETGSDGYITRREIKYAT